MWFHHTNKGSQISNQKWKSQNAKSKVEFQCRIDNSDSYKLFWQFDQVLLFLCWCFHNQVLWYYIWNMYCPGCGCRCDYDEQIYCNTCSSARDINNFLRSYFDRGYPYDAIVGLLGGKGMQISRDVLKLLTSMCGVVVTTLVFQAGRPWFKPWSDLYSRS